jgi:hypothetical protein
MQRSGGTWAEPPDSARVVPVVARRGSPVAAAALAAVLGLLGALLVFAIAAFVLDEPAQRAPGRGLVLGSLIAGWALSTWLLARRTARLHVVLGRGLVLGAVQWLALALLVGTVPDEQLPRAGALLREALGGLPLRLPDEGEALLFAALCLLGALALAGLHSALGLSEERPARRDAPG